MTKANHLCLRTCLVGLLTLECGFALPQEQTKLADGFYEIVSNGSGKALDVEGGRCALANGVRVQQYGYEGGDNQKWHLSSVGGSYRIAAKNSDKVLDVRAAATGNGSAVQQWEWHGAPNQLWLIVPVGDNSFKIQGVNSGRVLDVTGLSRDDGAKIQIWDWTGADNQKWKLVPLPDLHGPVNSASCGSPSATSPSAPPTETAKCSAAVRDAYQIRGSPTCGGQSLSEEILIGNSCPSRSIIANYDLIAEKPAQSRLVNHLSVTVLPGDRVRVACSKSQPDQYGVITSYGIVITGAQYK